MTPEDEAELGFVFPFRQITCPGSACADHSALDEFTAHKDDPVWQYITPPNGPQPCYCSVLCLMESDVAADDPGRTAGIPRLPPALLARCGEYSPR